MSEKYSVVQERGDFANPVRSIIRLTYLEYPEGFRALYSFIRVITVI